MKYLNIHYNENNFMSINSCNINCLLVYIFKYDIRKDKIKTNYDETIPINNRKYCILSIFKSNFYVNYIFLINSLILSIVCDSCLDIN